MTLQITLLHRRGWLGSWYNYAESSWVLLLSDTDDPSIFTYSKQNMKGCHGVRVELTIYLEYHKSSFLDT